MKRAVSILVLLCLVMVLGTGTAFAAADGEEQAEPSPNQVEESEPEVLLPIDVIKSDDGLEIRKVYEVDPNTDPELLPRADFEREDRIYECSDVLREIIIGEEYKVLTQTETVESTKNDMTTVLGLLPQEKEIVTEEGFSGVLRLNTSTIKTEASTYGSGSKEISAVREYPNLSDADTQYLPKTIQDSGRTLTLSNVEWRSDNTMNVDDYEITDRYTAVVTYAGTQTYSYVKTYTTTADYTGEVYKAGTVAIRYTVIFSGTEKEIPSTPEPDQNSSGILDPTDKTSSIIDVQNKPDATNGMPGWVLPIAAVVLIAAGITTFIVIKKRKEKAQYEETTYVDGVDGYHADNDDYTGPGSGV